MTTVKQDAMVWMNDHFGSDIDQAVAGTPLTKELVIAIAIQETYYVWSKMYKTAKPSDVLAICVGDTIDFPKRAKAWPKNRKDLEAHANGAAMFKVARDALESVAEFVPSFKKMLKNPDKFCHGFGMFQYDIQFFRENQQYFLKRKWATWSGTLGRGVDELSTQLRALYGDKEALSHDESVYVAIAYNRGAKGTKADIAKKRFKQGHRDNSGIYYGEHIDANLKAMKGLW